MCVCIPKRKSNIAFDLSLVEDNFERGRVSEGSSNFDGVSTSGRQFKIENPLECPAMYGSYSVIE